MLILYVKNNLISALRMSGCTDLSQSQGQESRFGPQNVAPVGTELICTYRHNIIERSEVNVMIKKI